MKAKQYKFVCDFDTFECDILFINQFDIIFFYNPANKSIYLQTIKTKSPEETSQTIDPFMKYNDSLYKEDSRDKNLFNEIVTDLGNEFKGQFQKECDDFGIQHRLVPLNMIDHLQLASINSMTQFIRQFIFNSLQQNNITSLTQDILQRICEEANTYFNTKHKNSTYQKTPQNITREDVQNYNEEAINKNKLIEVKNQFKIGDIVSIKTKRQQFEKARTYKFTKASYKIIKQLGRQYVLEPLNYDRQTLVQCLKQRQQNIDLYTIPNSKPVYIRKYYEIQKSQETNLYNPYEIETPMFYEFNKIQGAYKKEGQKLFPYEQDYTSFSKLDNKQQYYFIYTDEKQQKPVNIQQLRFLNVKHISNAEIDFWFFQNKKEINSIYIYQIFSNSIFQQQ